MSSRCRSCGRATHRTTHRRRHRTVFSQDSFWFWVITVIVVIWALGRFGGSS